MPITKAQIEQLTDPNTLVLILDGGIDAQIAERWIRQQAPAADKDQRVYTELHLHHLQANQAVCAVFRSPETPAMNHVVNAQGSLVSVPRPDSETFPELLVTKPVKVGDYWHRENPRTPGKPDTAAFLQALNESLIPYRLNPADKGEQKPTVMKLGTL